ncbi:hypothetical protein NUACC21_03140 [Scytonema sp. NUACC21]
MTDLESDKLQLSLGLERNAGEGIPDYITYKDNGDGTLTLLVAPGVNASANNYTFKLVATEVRSDGNTALKNELTFNVNIIAPNSAPKIGYIGDKVAVLGETLDLIINTTDRDSDALTYSFTGLPSGVAFVAPTGIYGQARLTWVPTINDVGKIIPVTITVSDSGNNGKGDVLSDTQTLNVVVRASNTAPVWSTIAPQTVNENSTLNLQLAANDTEVDKLTYDVRNLPVGAVFNRETGLLAWTPDYTSAGTYNISVIASDGNKSATGALAITVNNTNQVPIFTPLAVQYGQENERVTFKLVADDADGASVEYTAVGTLPQGAILDSRTGEFSWKPNYEQAGEHILKFLAKDPGGATTTLDVVVSIANVNRVPRLTISDRAVVLGNKLEFKLDGSDLDASTTLKYSAINLPSGATLDAATGQFSWQPNPGQVGNYTVTFQVSDGDLTATQNVLIKVALTSVLPTVTLDLTPSFPAVPGQKVVIQSAAASGATITSLTAKVAGQVVPIDTFGRFEFTPTAPGKVVVEAIAVDADGRIGTTSKVVQIRDVNDDAAPRVSFVPGLENSKVTSITSITGEISDTNLDEWVLEIAELNSNEFSAIASGTQSQSGVLSEFDPGEYVNGFYQLRLRATDISGRASTTTSNIEVSTATKNAYIRQETDLTTTIGGTTLNIIRTYNSLLNDETLTFGDGWSLANVDADIQTNVGHWSFVIGHLSLVICHLSFVIGYS